MAARYQGNHQHCLYAESQQIGALVLRNCLLGIVDALYGNRLVETVASVIKRPRVPSFRISGLSRRHHSTVLEDKFEAQNVFFDVTQSQSGRDSAELARDGSRYLSEELIEFGHRGEGVKASAKCFVGSRKLRRALLRKQFPFACHGRSHFLGTLRLGDVGRDATNRVWLPYAVAQKKFCRDIHPFAPIRGHGFFELDRHASFDYLPVIVTNRFGNLWRMNIEVGFAADLVASNTMATLIFAVNQKVTKVKILNENDSRSVVDNVL